MAKNDPEKYEAMWKLHGKYIKFGFDSFQYRDRVAPLLRYYSTAQDDKLTSLDDYVSRMKPDQKEIWYVAASSMEAAKVNPRTVPPQGTGGAVSYRSGGRVRA